MIEFKGNCGHTVRAKDEDAGGVVRCSYCGIDTPVPSNETTELDFLFSEVGQQEEHNKTKRIAGGKGRLWSRRRGKAPGSFDPLALILRMCYAALLISVVVFVGGRFVLPWYRDMGAAAEAARTSANAKPIRKQPRKPRANPVRSFGLIGRDDLMGLYVGSTPPNAAVWCIKASKAPGTGRIEGVAGCMQSVANGGRIRMREDGDYVVEVVLRWNDSRLNNPSLPYHDQYKKFRRAIETASDEERTRLCEDFFLPDEASRVFIDETAEQKFIVRQYDNVQVQNGRSRGVRALFLPRITEAGSKSFLLAPLVQHYLPKDEKYAFDAAQLRTELDYYEVPSSQWTFVSSVLARVGVTPFITPDGRTRLFKIGIDDGAFAVRVIRETEP